MADTPDVSKSAETRRLRWPSRERVVAASRAVGWRALRLGGEALSVLIALGIGILYFASGLAARQTADLDPLKPTFERWFSQSFEGARAETGNIDLEWNPADETVTFTASDVVVFSKEGEVVQTLDTLRATTSRDNLFARRTALSDVEVVGGEVTWRRNEDGSVIAGLGSAETVGGFGPVFQGRQDNREPAALEWLREFRSVSLVNSRANIVDLQDGLDLKLDVARLDGIRRGEVSKLDLDARLSTDDAAGSITLSLASNDDLQTYRVNLVTGDLKPDLLAPERGRLSVLNVFSLPIDATLDATYGLDTGLSAAFLDFEASSGTLNLSGRDRQVQSLALKAALDPGDEVMQVETISVQADRLSLSGAGVIRDIGRLYDGDVGTSPKFDLALGRSRIDVTPILAAPLSVASAKAIGELDLDSRSLTLDSLSADFGDFGLSMRANVATSGDGLADLTLIGSSTSPMTAENLLSLWPVNAADGARRWIERSVVAGSLDNIRFSVALDKDFFETPGLTEERLQLAFDVHDGEVKYIRTMSPLTGASGSGRINGNQFDFQLESGQIDDVAISSGTVSIPRLIPHGGDILLEANAVGRTSSLLKLINQPPFQYMDRYGVDPDGFGGVASVTLGIKRPLLEYFDQNRIEYSVDGRFEDASIPFQLGGFGVADADVTVTGGKEGLFVNGPANIGPWRANIGWEERYGQNGEPTRYRVNGILDQSALDGFGLGLRQFFGGDIGVAIEASGQGLNVRDATLDLDLTESEISFGDIWSKSVGEAGRFEASLAREEDGFGLNGLQMRAPGLDLAGQVRLSPNLALETASLDRAVIEGLIDGRMTLAPDTVTRRLKLDASGTRLDVSDFVQDGLRNTSGASEAFALSVAAAFEELVLAPDYVLEGASVIYRHDGEAIERLALSGGRPAGAFDVRLQPSETSAERQATLVIPDLSEATSQLLNLQTIEGGNLQMQAKLPPASMDGPIIGTVSAADFTVRDAPFLAQILSLASLTGFLDTLSGEGLAFDGLDFDFALQTRELSVREARLRGPAIGMTGEGDIALDERTIDFGGTLVPSYTANSFLGDIPLLGDIFVGKEGEGVFAVTYSVDGSFSQATIAINPLSALTPGFIRGIFREKRDDIPDSVVEEIESVRPDPEED